VITLTPEIHGGDHDLMERGGWNTESMERVRHQQPSRGSTPGKVRRWLLLAAVIAGIFGMHVLTAEDGTSRHGALPMISTAGHAEMTGHDPQLAGALPLAVDAAVGMAGVAVVTAADPGSGGDHGAMAGCILFLAVGAAALILVLLRLRGGPGLAGIGRLAGTSVSDMRRRGPPGRWPRLALCVIRV
jgi:hypothetical protein